MKNLSGILELRKKCPHFPYCECNICPIDPDFEERTWIAEETEIEPICHNRNFKRHPLVKAQLFITREIRKGKRKKVLDRPLSGHWYGAELLQLAEYLEKRRQKRSLRMKQLIREGKISPPKRKINED